MVTGGWCITGSTAIRIAGSRLPLVAPPPAPPETPEERAARLRIEAQRVRAEASARARKLLLKHLTKKQRREYEANQWFTVTSSAGNTFKIQHGRGHNVFLLDEQGEHVTCYCGNTRDNVPAEDNILAQKLLIETDEAGFRRVSNASQVARRR